MKMPFSVNYNPIFTLYLLSRLRETIVLVKNHTDFTFRAHFTNG